MKAAVRYRFGEPREVVEIREIEKPAPAEDEVLVRVRATSLNLSDWYSIRGKPWLARISTGLRTPKAELLGTDYAGVVEAVGTDVTDFRPGDEVFGGRTGAFAEYVVAKADRAIVPKPANATFEEAAGVPVAALTALQAIRDKGRLQPGQRVLVHGASGGVGTYAVQVAKALGGDVTAVCSTRNVEQARALGADRVVDYTREDFTRDGQPYDLVVDIAGTRSWSACKRILAKDGTFVLVGGPRSGSLLGPIRGVIWKKLGGIVGRRKVVSFIAKVSKEDMQTLRELLESGRIRTVVDRRYELDQIAEALDYLGRGHPGGKVIIGV